MQILKVIYSVLGKNVTNKKSKHYKYYMVRETYSVVEFSNLIGQQLMTNFL